MAGNDTGVGKTHTTKILLDSLRADGIDAVGYKPIVCGDRDDAHILAAASGGLALEKVNPLWLKTPVAPWIAAQLENVAIDVQPLIDGFHALAAAHELVIVEGCGGWEVPIRLDYSMADFAQALGLPVVLVVANKLGAINHTVLSCQAIRARKMDLLGLIMNHLVDEFDTATISNKHSIPQLAQLPILAEVIHQQDWIETDWLTEA
jgi:dethiobiotin synthetase